MIIFAYVVVGLLAGILSGLLGIGGGIVVVPLLSEIFSLSGFPVSRVMQSAVATSLAIMVFTTASAALSHYRSGHLKRELIVQFLPGMCVGVIWGSVIAHQLSSLDLELIFSLLLVFIAYRLWFKKTAASGPKPGWLSMGLSSFLIGGMAGLLGIGGGVLSVPYLLRYKISAKQAMALGSVFSFGAAVLGTLTWALLSNPAPLPHTSMSWTYINWPAALIAGGMGILVAPFAVKWAKHIPELYLRRAFAVLLLVLFLQKFMSWFWVVIQ